jgi:hypothetical protein
MGNFFHSSEQIGKKNLAMKKIRTQTLHMDRILPPCMMGAWQMFCLTRILQIQRKEIAHSLRLSEAQKLQSIA